jgi:hypothetical protein
MEKIDARWKKILRYVFTAYDIFFKPEITSTRMLSLVNMLTSFALACNITVNLLEYHKILVCFH